MIDPQEVHKAFVECLSASPGSPDATVVDGIMGHYVLHRGVLEIYRPKIIDWLNDLPTEFHKSGGGGWSFLNVCTDRHGNLWTGMHQTCEELLMLGKGLDMVRWLMPREMWDAFPGGMPYLVIDTTV